MHGFRDQHTHTVAGSNSRRFIKVLPVVGLSEIWAVRQLTLKPTGHKRKKVTSRSNAPVLIVATQCNGVGAKHLWLLKVGNLLTDLPIDLPTVPRKTISWRLAKFRTSMLRRKLIFLYFNIFCREKCLGLCQLACSPTVPSVSWPWEKESRVATSHLLFVGPQSYGVRLLKL